MEEKTEMDRGMGQIPPNKHPEILKTAHKYRIDENDPTWILVNLVVESLGGIEKITNSGTKALREASVAVTAATSAEVKAGREKAGLEITKMQETAKANITAALSGILETEIRNAVFRLQSQTNRPLHKKWLIAMGVVILLAVGGGAWGLWSFYTYAKNVGEVKMSMFMRSNDFTELMNCDLPGWKTQWVGSGKEKKHACYPYHDKSGHQNGWEIP